MHFKIALLSATITVSIEKVYAAPASPPSSSQVLSNPSYGPIPGESSYYSTYTDQAAPFPANFISPILPTTNGPAGPDDLLFQNLLSAEYVVYSFYQSGVEAFSTSSFTSLGFPNTTYSRIIEIRDNEAGHLRIFQDQISSNSIKPGPCQYEYGYTGASEFLAVLSLIETASMAFLTGLVQEAQLNASKGALLAIGETESRHNTWSLIDIWKASPFAGPADTWFPYANQILDLTNEFIVPGSCPPQNPIYPSPRQNLPKMNTGANTTSIAPGSNITFQFTDLANQPTFSEGEEYYAVFFHGLFNISVAFDTKTNGTTIPAAFEEKGIIIGVIADEPGAPTLASVLAGPVLLLQQPGQISVALSE